MSWRDAASPRNAGRLAVVLLLVALTCIVTLDATGGQQTLVAAGVNGPDYAPPVPVGAK